jgi:hypothetical protein
VPTSIFQSTNPLLQDAYDRYFLRHHVPPPEEEQGTTSEKALMDKQKWKMLKMMPGQHQGNTWMMMGALNKGLAPATKSAEVKEARLGAVQKGLLGVGGTAAAGTVGYTAHNANNLMNRAGNFIDESKQQIGDLTNKIQNVADQGQQFIQSQQNATRPWTDMLNQVGGGLAGLLGVQGYNKPQWYQSFVNWLQKIFSSGQYNKFTNPETGVGGADTKLGEMTMITNVEAVNIALNGSPLFQKQASADGEIAPDQPLQSHLVVADEMESMAGVMSSQPQTLSYAHAFKEAAAHVRRGYPAKSAVLVSLGGSKKLAEVADRILEGIGQSIIERVVMDSFQQKVAEYHAKKMASATG